MCTTTHQRGFSWFPRWLTMSCSFSSVHWPASHLLWSIWMLCSLLNQVFTLLILGSWDPQPHPYCKYILMVSLLIIMLDSSVSPRAPSSCRHTLSQHGSSGHSLETKRMSSLPQVFMDDIISDPPQLCRHLRLILPMSTKSIDMNFGGHQFYRSVWTALVLSLYSSTWCI